MALFDPKTFTYDQLNSLKNVAGESLATSNTPEQIKAAQNLTMTPEGLGNVKPLPIQPISQTGIPDISPLEAELNKTYQPTASEQRYSSVSSDLMNTYNQLVGVSGDTTALQESTGLNQAQQNYDELSGQLNALITERKSIPLQLQEKSAGITTGVLGAMTESELRKNATAALGVSALMDASKGRIDSAQRKIDQAIAAKYGPVKAKIATLEAQLNLIKNDPMSSLEDKRRADLQLSIQNKMKAETEQKAADEKSVREIMLLAAKYGATPSEISAIGASASPMDAIVAAGQRLQDPVAKLELEGKRLDLAIKSAQLRKLNQPTGTTPPDQKKIAADKAVIPTLQDKINLIDELKNSKGLNSSVGPNALSRFGIVDRFTGEKQNFIAGVQQLISQDTLNTLLNLKAQGGTLGALSEGEGRLLQSAASRIGVWAVKDKDGNITGYNASESAFKKELDNIKRLTQRALDNAQSSTISPDESAALDSYFGSSASGLPPESFFQP